MPDKCAQYVVPQFNIITGEETMPVYEPGTVIDGVRVDLCTADSRANAKPSTTHWLGTDSSARDTFARAGLRRPGGHDRRGRHHRHRPGGRRDDRPDRRVLPGQESRPS